MAQHAPTPPQPTAAPRGATSGSAQVGKPGPSAGRQPVMGQLRQADGYEAGRRVVAPKAQGRADLDAATPGGPRAGASGAGQAGRAAQAGAAAQRGRAAVPIAVPHQLTDPMQGADAVDIIRDADGPCVSHGNEGNAMWSMTPNVSIDALCENDMWHIQPTALHWDIRWHLNPAAQWNNINEFPGGPYIPSFNTREGSECHELAEIEGVRRNLLELVITPHQAFSHQVFASRAIAEEAYHAMVTPLAAAVSARNHAISAHANPLGPNAEWAYYQSRAGGQHPAPAHGAAATPAHPGAAHPGPAHSSAAPAAAAHPATGHGGH